jgi:signal peptidase I
VTPGEVPFWAGIAVSAAAVSWAVWTVRRRFALVTVAGPSMLPTLGDGDHVLVRRVRITDVQVGQVVVVERPDDGGGWTADPPQWPGIGRRWLIKRIAALPGDNWPTDALAGRGRSKAAAPPAAFLPPGQFAVLGDNRAVSYDSREMGCVPAARLLGVVVRPRCLSE